MKLIKIGRTEGNDLVIKDDTTISRNHAEIFQNNEGNVFLTDLNSSNGTFVNGNKLEDSIILKKKDIVKIGNTVIDWKIYLSENKAQKIKDEEIKEKTENKILLEDLPSVNNISKNNSYYLFIIPVIISIIYINLNYGFNNIFFVFDILSLLFIPSIIAFIISAFSKIKFEYSLSIFSIIIITVQHFIN
tara:strand:- start:259 stop:825 length:567 start_codon:yes stop_codon:yes gene_type:complete